MAPFDSLASRYDQVLPVFGHLGGGVVRSLPLSEGQRLLDVGCGRGAIAIAARGRGADVTAVDVAPAMVAHLRADQPTLDVREMDAHRLSFPEGSFDWVVAALVLHVLPRPDLVVLEMKRVVRDDGCVVVTLPGALDERWTEFFELFGQFEPAMSAPRIAQPVDASELLLDAGLREIAEWQVEVSVGVESPEQVWEHEMTHGFAGYVASLSPGDQQAFKRRVFQVLRRMESRGDLIYTRCVAVTVGRR